MNFVTKIILSSLLVGSFAVSALGLSLDEARAKGIVTELPTGYIKANKPEGKVLETSVNAKRKKAYEKIAKKTTTSIDVVGASAHKKIMRKLGK